MIALSVVVLLALAAIGLVFGTVFYLSWTQASAARDWDVEIDLDGDIM